MRDENGIWCDIRDDRKNKICGKTAERIHNCKVEQSEFALCKNHNRWWMSTVHGKPEQQMHCPRCLPGFLARNPNLNTITNSLPPPITGPLADAFEAAMHLEGILVTTRTRILQRLAAQEDEYVAAIFRSTQVTENYEDEVSI